MKKLMIAAALAAITAGAYAGCSVGPGSCSVKFTVKFSGKTATQTYDKKGEDKGYASVQKLSGKGTLTFDDIDYVEEFSQVKVGKVVFGGDNKIVLTGGTVDQWTYFGKGLEALQGGEGAKPGKSFNLESDLGLTFTGGDDEDGTGYSIDVVQVAFGKAKGKLSKEGKSTSGCVVTPVAGCVPSITIKNYSGWFTGSFTPICADVAADPYGECIPFADNGIALIGGTWSAKPKK